MTNNLCDPYWSCWLDEPEEPSIALMPDSWDDDTDWPEFDDPGDYDLPECHANETWRVF